MLIVIIPFKKIQCLSFQVCQSDDYRLHVQDVFIKMVYDGSVATFKRVAADLNINKSRSYYSSVRCTKMELRKPILKEIYFGSLFSSAEIK